MRMSLLIKNKIGFIDGLIQGPEKQDATYAYWSRYNTLILAWIIWSLYPAIAQLILWIDNACTLWFELVEKFSQTDMFHFSNLQEEMFSFHQGNQLVTTYFTSLKPMLDELEVLIPVTKCACGVNCTCDVLGKVKEQWNILHATHFLKGLNEQYSAH